MEIPSRLNSVSSVRNAAFRRAGSAIKVTAAFSRSDSNCKSPCQHLAFTAVTAPSPSVGHHRHVRGAQLRSALRWAADRLRVPPRLGKDRRYGCAAPPPSSWRADDGVTTDGRSGLLAPSRLRRDALALLWRCSKPPARCAAVPRRSLPVPAVLPLAQMKGDSTAHTELI